MKQFNWQRNWKKVVPYLQDRDVQIALELGLTIINPYRKMGDPPWEEGRGPLNGQRAIKGKLSWYQPWGRCHWIAPFAHAIGKKLYPKYEWGFMTSDVHSVAVGLDNEEIKIVMDILSFKDHSAEQSLELVKSMEWELCFSIRDLFVKDPINELIPI